MRVLHVLSVCRLEAVQQLYDKRESREEDLEMIKKLRYIVGRAG